MWRETEVIGLKCAPRVTTREAQNLCAKRITGLEPDPPHIEPSSTSPPPRLMPPPPPPPSALRPRPHPPTCATPSGYTPVDSSLPSFVTATGAGQLRRCGEAEVNVVSLSRTRSRGENRAFPMILWVRRRQARDESVFLAPLPSQGHRATTTLARSTSPWPSKPMSTGELPTTAPSTASA
ncbi:hypothetical protein VPH35_008777 [Triticum aestivum]